MATIDSKHIIDTLIENNGWYPGDHIQVVKIVEYTNAYGKRTHGIVYSTEMQYPGAFDRYEIESEYIINPRVIWRAEAK